MIEISKSNKNTVEDEILNGSIKKVLFKLALPAIVAQVINAVYNMVDRMYIARIEDVGSLALTGLGVSFPIIIIISAFGALVGFGGAPLASIALGRGDKKKAEEVLGNSMTLITAIGIIVTIAAFIVKDKALYLFGASDLTFQYANEYLTIYILGTIFVMFSLGLNPFINSQGFAKTGMVTILIGALLNIILDPIFIFVFDMGIKGAAYATILSQAVSGIWILKFLTGKKTLIKIRKENLKVKLSNAKRILALGLSPFIMQSTESLVQIALNASLLRYGGDVYVGAMTIISSFMQMVTMPLAGVTQGAQPIISYNYGAKQYGRVKEAFKYTFITCITFTTIGWAIAMFIPQLPISIFTSDPALMEASTYGMRIFMSMILVFGAQIACQNTFVALGHAKVSIFLAILRKIILLIPLTFILPNLFDFGLFGVFLGEPIADLIAASTTVIVFTKFMKKTLKIKNELETVQRKIN